MRRHTATVLTVGWSSLRYTVIGLILVSSSACIRNPNLIPDGYGEIFKDDARSAQAARVDYPVVANVDQAATSVNFRVTKKGERHWIWSDEYGKRPFLKKLNWYRVTLLAPGVDAPICVTNWTRPGEANEIELPCMFPVRDQLSKPLLAMLDFWATDDNDNPPGPDVSSLGVVDRLYYLIPIQ